MSTEFSIAFAKKAAESYGVSEDEIINKIKFICGYKPITLSGPDCDLINAKEKALQGIRDALCVPERYLGENDH
jgi:hypothetical protein